MPPTSRPSFTSLRPGLLLGAAAILIVVALLVPTANSAQASLTSGPAVVVSMGDSMIAGTAGRWKGNSLTDTGSRDGTDRTCIPGPNPGSCSSYDLNSVYLDGTGEDGCTRSDSAEVLSARIPGLHGINIACGGATAQNLLTSAQGGKRFRGEPPQGDRLAKIAEQHKIRMIIIDLGGNNLPFAPTLVACAEAYGGLAAQKTCTADEGAFRRAIPQSIRAIEHVVADTRQTMKAHHYQTADYRIILQDYAIGLPPANQVRYPQADKTDRINAGCPYSNSDLTWIKDVGDRQLALMVKTAAEHSHTEFQDISNTLDGHEVCSTHDSLVSAQHPPSAKTSEWMRFLSYAHVLAQAAPASTDVALGDVLHPDYYGQLAFGSCLTQTAASPAGQHTCTTIPRSTHTQVATTTSAVGECTAGVHGTSSVKQPAGGNVTTERVYRDGKLWRTFHGARITEIPLPAITSPSFTLKLEETTTNHLHITTTLKYRGCHS